MPQQQSILNVHMAFPLRMLSKRRRLGLRSTLSIAAFPAWIETRSTESRRGMERIRMDLRLGMSSALRGRACDLKLMRNKRERRGLPSPSNYFSHFQQYGRRHEAEAKAVLTSIDDYSGAAESTVFELEG